jgi:hypothetical protein
MGIQYDGVDDAVNYGSPAVLDDLDPVTATGLLNVTTYPGVDAYESHFTKTSVAASETYWYYPENIAGAERMAIFIGFDVTAAAASAAVGTYPTGSFRDIATIFDTTLTNDVRMFSNGAEVSYAAGPTAGATTRTSDAAQDARTGVDGTGSFFGNMFLEDVRLYNRALTDNEIATIAACRGTDGIVSGLVARWLAIEGAPGTTVTTVRDYTVNGNNGTPAGSPVYATGTSRYRRKVA